MRRSEVPEENYWDCWKWLWGTLALEEEEVNLCGGRSFYEWWRRALDGGSLRCRGSGGQERRLEEVDGGDQGGPGQYLLGPTSKRT